MDAMSEKFETDDTFVTGKFRHVFNLKYVQYGLHSGNSSYPFNCQKIFQSEPLQKWVNSFKGNDDACKINILKFLFRKKLLFQAVNLVVKRVNKL